MHFSLHFIMHLLMHRCEHITFMIKCIMKILYEKTRTDKELLKVLQRLARVLFIFLPYLYLDAEPVEGLLRDRVLVTHVAHIHRYVGSIPTPATQI